MIISIINQKGGVGKTTTALATIEGLTAPSRRALAIDLDGQANFSTALEGNTAGNGTGEMIKGNADFIQAAPLADLIAANESLYSLSDLDPDATAAAIKKAAAPYKYAVIDTPPTFGTLSLAAVLAADFIVIPTTIDIDAINAVVSVYEEIADLGEDAGRIAGILPQMVNLRTNYARALLPRLQKIAADADTIIFEPIPAAANTIQTARLLKKPILSGKAGKSKAGIAYNNYIRALKRRLKK